MSAARRTSGRTTAQKWRRTLIVASCLLGSGGALVLVANRWIERSAASFVADDEHSVPARSVAIVLGAHVLADGRPSGILEDRLAVARDLYRAGKVRRILVSGDHASDGYDEVNAMQHWLLEAGIPASDVFLDHAGLRTLDTMERAARVFRVREAIVCTQAFHLPRAVFLARNAGIDAVGVKADRRPYLSPIWNEAREIAARTRAFLDVYVLGTSATYLGEETPIDGDARATHDARSGGSPGS